MGRPVTPLLAADVIIELVDRPGRPIVLIERANPPFGHAIPGDGFDGWQNVWNLWWMRESWLVRQASPYFAPILHYPTGADLRFQTMAPFNGLASLPIQLVFGLLPAYNAAALFSFIIGGFGAYLLALYALRRWSRQVGKKTRKQGARIG